MKVMAIKWRNQEVRSYNGLMCSNGDIYEVHETWMARVHENRSLAVGSMSRFWRKKSYMVDST